MIDHERFRLLAAAEIGGTLTPDETRDLEAHLASCPVCRVEATKLKRDQALLVAALAEVPVASRVRSAVTAEARGTRRTTAWPILAAAALLVLVLAASAVVVGSRQATPTPSKEPSAAIPTSPSPSAAQVVTINGAYAYSPSAGAQRRDSVAVRGGDPPTGTWSRLVPDTGAFLGGPVSCLVVDGPDAWMAGPATQTSEGVTGSAALLYVHDSGEAGGAGDTAVTWIADPGETLETMEGWCRSKYIPAGPFALEEGDIVIGTGP